MKHIVHFIMYGLMCVCRTDDVIEGNFRADPSTGIIEHSRTFEGLKLDSEIHLRGDKVPACLIRLDLEDRAGILIVVSDPSLDVRIFRMDEKGGGRLDEVETYMPWDGQPHSITVSKSFYLGKTLVV